MTNLRMWRPTRDAEYDFFDENIKEAFIIGGVDVYYHKYIGPNTTNDKKKKKKKISETVIQDLLFLENRDVNYDSNIYEITIMYNVQDMESNLSQFNLIFENDIIYIEIHTNDTVSRIGRKPMIGDVIEMYHLRDDLLLNEGPAINKFYVIDDVVKAAGGYTPLWHSHILRLKLKPMTDSQEYYDILNRVDEFSDKKIKDLISTYGSEINISETITDIARTNVDRRNFETAHLYVVPGTEDGINYPWIFAGDGQPPNGAELSGQGNRFPDPNSTEIKDGDWFLHTGYEPAVLYKRESGVWVRKEIDYRKKWVAAHRILASYINNDKINTIDGEQVQEKQALSQVGLPRARLK